LSNPFAITATWLKSSSLQPRERKEKNHGTFYNRDYVCRNCNIDILYVRNLKIQRKERKVMLNEVKPGDIWFPSFGWFFG